MTSGFIETIMSEHLQAFVAWSASVPDVIWLFLIVGCVAWWLTALLNRIAKFGK